MPPVACPQAGHPTLGPWLSSQISQHEDSCFCRGPGNTAQVKADPSGGYACLAPHIPREDGLELEGPGNLKNPPSLGHGVTGGAEDPPPRDTHARSWNLGEGRENPSPLILQVQRASQRYRPQESGP